MAQVKLLFYATPNQARNLGRTITKETSINETEARKIRDYYNSLDEGAGTAFDIFVGAMVTLVTANAGIVFQSILGGGATVFSKALFKTYYGQLADKFDMITNDKPKKCSITYSYRQHGSFSGAYWITNIIVK